MPGLPWNQSGNAHAQKTVLPVQVCLVSCREIPNRFWDRTMSWKVITIDSLMNGSRTGRMDRCVVNGQLIGQT